MKSSKLETYIFGMNDEAGHLIEIKVPAYSKKEALQIIGTLVRPEHCVKHKIWLNAVEDYD